MIVPARDQPTPRCPTCGTVMRLCAIFPRLDTLPEILSFGCAPCQEMVTLVEREPPGAAAIADLDRADPGRSVAGQA